MSQDFLGIFNELFLPLPPDKPIAASKVKKPKGLLPEDMCFTEAWCYTNSARLGANGMTPCWFSSLAIPLLPLTTHLK
jgi:hypothetical protein